MRITFKLTLLSMFLAAIVFSFSACGGGSDPSYGVIYEANGANSGTVPIDSADYKTSDTVTVLGNVGDLARTGYTFAGWCINSDGSGTSYAQGQTFTMGSENVVLYAKWTLNPTYTVTYDGNNNTEGTAPIDTTNYEQSNTVTVLGNTGNLARIHYTFAGWSTTADGQGTNYAQGQTFEMGTDNVILYARWTLNPTFTVTYDGNGNSGGSVPVDSTHYEQGDEVTVPGNTGNLYYSQDGIPYLFVGWNTQADGNGTLYTEAQTFNMGASNVVLYAIWEPSYILPTTATDISLGAKSALVDGNKVYVIEGTTFKVIDVSDPLNPVLLGSVTHGYTDLRVEAHVIYNNIVWCVRSSSGGMGADTHIFGVDVSDPENPVVRGSLTLQTNSSLLSNVSRIYDGYLLVHDYSRNIIYVIDVSDPDAPSLYSQWSVPNMVNGGPGFMLIEGSLLYLPCGENKTLRIYDLTDLSSISEVGSVSTGSAEYYGNIAKIGSYVYGIATVYLGNSYMEVIDVSNPASPSLVRSIQVNLMTVRERNGRLFSFDYSTPTIKAYSLADPENPVVEASSTVAIPAPSTSLNLTPLSWPSADWVGDYLIGLTWGSATQFNGVRALDFTVN